MKYTLRQKSKAAFLVCCALILLLGIQKLCLGQAGSNQSLILSGYSNDNANWQAYLTANLNNDTQIFIAYGIIVSQSLEDKDDSTYFLDPNGMSIWEDLMLDAAIEFYDPLNPTKDFILSNGGVYFVEFGAKAPNNTNANLNEFYARRFIMRDSGPGADTGMGKYVYDIAESIKVADAQPGDVVIISTEEDLTLVKSKTKFDTKVAGVISADPKIFMGATNEAKSPNGYSPLALAGIVACNVTAQNGAIKKGDLLVSSSIPGHAMRADVKDIKPGMVVGSALEEWLQGQGKINILVNQ